MLGSGLFPPMANPLTVPPYLVGTIFLLCFAYASDYYQKRAGFILPALIIIMIGLIMTFTIPLHNAGGYYALLLPLLASTSISGPIEVSWLAGSNPEPGKRTTILAINGWVIWPASSAARQSIWPGLPVPAKCHAGVGVSPSSAISRTTSN